MEELQHVRRYCFHFWKSYCNYKRHGNYYGDLSQW